MKHEDILDEYIHKYFMEEAVHDRYMRMLISNTIEFKLYTLKVMLKRCIDSILRRK